MDRILNLLKLNVRSALPSTSLTFLVLLFLIFLSALLFLSYTSGLTQEHEMIRNLGLVVAALIGFPMIIWRTHIADRQASTAEASHVAETYTKAIEQLGAADDKGHPKLELRLGALYSLEKIAKTNKDYHSQIIEVLCAYVRLQSRIQDDQAKDNSIPSGAVILPREDVQATLTIIGRRNLEFDPADLRLNLKSVDIEGADLSGLKLNKAILDGSCLRRVKADNTSISYCSFVRADLNSANLSSCEAIGSDFSGANLEKAVVEESNLSECSLRKTNLQEASFDNVIAVNIDARDADFAHSSIADTDFSGASLASSTFKYASAFTCFFDNVDINRADFTEATLQDSVFRKAKMNKAIFLDSELYHAVFEHTDFYGCDIKAEDLFHSRLDNVGPDELIQEVEELKRSAEEKVLN